MHQILVTPSVQIGDTYIHPTLGKGIIIIVSHGPAVTDGNGKPTHYHAMLETTNTSKTLSTLANLSKHFPDVNVMNIKVYTDYQKWLADSNVHHQGEFKQLTKKRGIGYRYLFNH